MKVGDKIETVYGTGELLGYKETTRVYEVQLSFGKLYARKDALQFPQAKQNGKTRSKKAAMEINDAYEALEKMRRLNLEICCQEQGITNVDYDRCVTCLFAEKAQEECNKNARFPRIRKVIDDTKKLKPTRSCSPCLTCGSPVCPSHTSSTFRAEKVNVCLDCEKLFNLEFVVDCLIMDKGERQKRVDHMIDLYDRTVLLLKYSSQYMDGVARSLEEAMARQNKIGVGGSTAGIMSGALGIAAAATILTPVGPPLLVASLLFGGRCVFDLHISTTKKTICHSWIVFYFSATAVQTGTEVKNRYFSEPHQLAANIIALSGMQKNILKVADTLRDAVARDMIIMENLQEDTEGVPLPDKVAEVYEQHRGGFLAGLTAGRLGMAGMEVGQMATAAEAGAVSARNARFFSRTSSNLLRTARFARFAGGAISAATLLLEAKCMNDTIRKIREGNPCDKAKSLRKIKQELSSIPSTADLDKECEAYLQAMIKRDRRMTEQEAVRLLIEATQAQAESERLAQENGAEGLLIVNGEEHATSKTLQGNSTGKSSPVSSGMSASLLQRIRKFKQREAVSISEVDPVCIDEAPADLLG